MSGASPLWDTQQAVYAALNNAVVVDGAQVPCFDAVAISTPLPYLTVGEWQCRNTSPKALYLWSVRGNIHAWTDYRGARQAAEMLDAVAALLSREAFTGPIGGRRQWEVIDSTVEGDDTFADLDGATRHGVLRVRILLQETPGVDLSS